MADFTDRIKLVFDTVTTGASAEMGKLKSAVGEAEGGFGKAKAAAGGLGNVISENLPLAAAGAGTAIAGFVVDAVGKFKDLALRAGEVASATGLSVDQASRWMEVAGDLNVSTEALVSSVGRLNKAAAQGKLDEYGIQAS